MISDIIETQEHIKNNNDSDNNSNNDSNNDSTPNVNFNNTSNNTKNICVSLSTDTHEKIYNFLIDEIKSHKQSNAEKEQHIESLNNKIEELLIQLNELEIKLNKMTNIGLLIKLKENLTNKQNDFESEINNINYDGNSCDNNNKNDIKFEQQSQEKTNTELTLENTKLNIVIEENDKQTNKPRKRLTMFRRHF